MPANSMAQRIIPHLRRVVQTRDAQTGDAQLLGEFVASQDEAAFALLVRRHGPMVLGVCRRVIGDPHLAEDAFQATFLVLARRAATIRPRHLVGHWLYGVAYRTALKARGTAARHRLREQQVPVMPQPAVSPEDAWSDLQPVLDEELSRLPEKLRVPVVLCDLGGRPQREVARELKLPPATLANRLAAARRLLAKRLSDRGIVLSTSAVAAAIAWHSSISAVTPALACATAKAARAIATGNVVGLPTPIVELSDGVMRMFVLKKLKALVVTCLLLLGGIGLIADSTLKANPVEKPAVPAKSQATAPVEESEDAKFLRRLSVSIRGVLPTAIELDYFVADRDSKKRQKVTEWMLPDHGKQAITNDCARCHKAASNHERWWLGELHSANPYLKRMLSEPSGWTDPLHEKLRSTDARIEASLAEAIDKQYRSDETVEPKLDRMGAAIAALAAMAASQSQPAVPKTKATENPSLRLLDYFKQAETGRHGPDSALLDFWTKGLESLRTPGDGEFLRRISLDLRGIPPTTVEMNYFVADKDPKKRDKLLVLMLKSAKGKNARDKVVLELLADPAVQQRWTQLWNARLAAEKEKEAAEERKRIANDRLSKLLGELLAAKRSDSQILEALCLATMARFPTETERLLTQWVKGEDREEKWKHVLRSLATNAEAKAHAEGLAKRAR